MLLPLLLLVCGLSQVGLIAINVIGVPVESPGGGRPRWAISLSPCYSLSTLLLQLNFVNPLSSYLSAVHTAPFPRVCELFTLPPFSHVCALFTLLL